MRGLGRTRFVVVACGVALAAAIVVLIAGLGSTPRHDAEVTIPRQAVLARVPRSFLGISTEYWTLPIWEPNLTLLERVLSLLRVDGPVTLRIGGDSADQSFLSAQQELPEWTFELTPAWLRLVSRIVHRSGVRLVLDLNLVTATPRIATLWGSTAEDRLPRGSVSGFEIGNEPDIYSRAYWLKTHPGVGGPIALPQAVTASSYAQAFAAYAAALRRVVPGVPLLAPALADPARNFSWVSRLLAGPHPGLSTVTAHEYPYSACARPSARNYPTIARVLSENASAGMARTARRVLRLSERAGLPLVLTEINSVTCGGTSGVSDTFATALWAPDALFELLRTGVEAVDVHVRARTINLAFALSSHGLIARPLLYGLILFTRALGADPQLVQLRVRSGASDHLKAWAVRVRGNALHLLLINKGQHPLRVALRLPTLGPATIQRLRAPSAGSRSGVLLDGQSLDQRGRWLGRPTGETLSPDAAGYHMAIPQRSAALMTLQLRPGALTDSRIRIQK